MRKQKHIVLLGLIGLLIMISFPVDVVAELTLNWSDDFNDGNYDGWTVNSGSYVVTSGKLTVTALAPGPSLPVILHSSNTTFGNWTFDVEIGDDPDYAGHVVIAFLRDHTGTSVFDSIVLWIEFAGDWTIGRNYDDLYSFLTVIEWEHHIRIQRTRADPNRIRVYHNDTLALDEMVIFPVGDYSYFAFSGTRGASIDNINVEYEDYIDDTTTPTTPTISTTPTDPTSSGTTDPPDMTMILMIAGGGAVVVVAIAIVVKMRS